MFREDAKQIPMLYANPITDEDVLLIFSSHEEFLTRRQIAERLFRQVAPALSARIERMVVEGRLYKVKSQLANGKPMFWYKIRTETQEGALTAAQTALE